MLHPLVREIWTNLATEEFQKLSTHPVITEPADGHSGWLVLQSFLVLLREGFEAILLIAALGAYLRRAGAADKVPVLYWGIGWALAASAATALLFSLVLGRVGAARETLEGVVMLAAAAILFYVSYWLFANREAARWQAYIRHQIDQALSRSSLLALGFAAFLAVYREGAEIILFYYALASQANGQTPALLAGAAVAVAALVLLYWLIHRISLKLPLHLFFGITSALLYYLVISFTGHGIHELQEAGWLPETELEGVPHLPWLGLYPTLEGTLVQGSLLALGLFTLSGWLRKTTR